MPDLMDVRETETGGYEILVSVHEGQQEWVPYAARALSFMPASLPNGTSLDRTWLELLRKEGWFPTSPTPVEHISPMAAMSRAIRRTIGEGRHIHDIPDDELVQYTEIVGAFYHDLKDERVRRAEERKS